MRKWLLIILLLVMGVIFRVWLISLVPQPVIFDASEYSILAERILYYPFYTDSFRSYGYPLIISFIYSVFGPSNYWAWKIMQSVMDVSVALMVFLMAGVLFRKNKPAAIITLVIYIFNPYTSSYAGLLLTESATIFFITLSFFLLLKFLEKKNIYYLLALGFVLGFLPQVRPGYIFFSFLLLIFISVYVFGSLLKTMEGKAALVLSLFLFCLPFVYNFIGNYRYRQQITPFLADNMFVQNLYGSLYVERYLPLFRAKVRGDPPEVRQMYAEYSSKTIAPQRKAVADKYMKQSIAKIESDPKEFVLSRFRKMWYIWEKHALFLYINEPQKYENYVYWGNIMLLVLFVIGLNGFWKKLKKKDFVRKWFVKLTILFIFYVSLVHAFTPNEERYSIPAYPLIFLFAGYGVFTACEKIKSFIFAFRPKNDEVSES